MILSKPSTAAASLAQAWQDALRRRGAGEDAATALPGRFQPLLTLKTLTRGDGLLGLIATGAIGPRGSDLTVGQIAWTYTTAIGLRWQTPAPDSVLRRRAPATDTLLDAAGQAVPMQRDRGAEADAIDRVRALGLHPVPPEALQWRSPEAGAEHRDLWTLAQEDLFGAFWAEQLPALRAEGWAVQVLPGFAHASVAIDGWRLLLSEDEAADAPPAASIRLKAPRRQGSWLLSLGIEVDGHSLDLAPLLAELLKRDGRWLDAGQIAAIDDTALVLLHGPGGRRIEAPAAPLKAVVSALLDLLTDPRPREGPLRLSSWDAHRLDAMRLSLLDTQQTRAGGHAAWQLQGEAGLHALAQRLQGPGLRAVAAPAGLGVSLRPYQLQGLAWLQYLREHRLAGILADDMGLGKTAQALAHLLIEKQAGRLDLPALAVLPSSLVFNWQAEAARIVPDLRVLALQGPDRAADFARIAEHDLVLSSYPLLMRDIAAMEIQPFHLLILDEAQSVKNAGGRGAQAVRRLQARHRLCLTGTPLENHLGELWAQFDFLMPGFLGDRSSFHRRWRKPIEENGETLRAQLLARRIRPFLLRRSKDGVARELPPLTEVIRRVQLGGRQRELYESVRVAADKQVRRLLQERGIAGAQVSVLAALLKLRQVCNDPYLLRGEKTPKGMERAKLELLRDMLPALVREGRRVLVFSQFTGMLDLIAAELDALQLPWLALTGKTTPAKRGALVARFQARGVPILLVSLKAGGVGLNLTAADTVIHVDPWWNPAVEQQATARAHRIGQELPVFEYKLVVEGSIEERMLELQARKRALAEGVLGRDGAASAKFSAEDLEGLLAPLR